MKKHLSLFLAALLCLLPIMTACSGDGEGKETTAAPSTASPDAVTTEAPVTKPVDALPTADYEGYQFNILSNSHNWAIVEMTAEEITGETLNDIIYKRQLATEERLKIKLSEQIVGDALAPLTNAVLAQTHEYDLVNIATGQALTAYQKGYTVDQTDIETLNLDNPWWAKSVNDSLNIGDKRYITFGESNLVYYSAFYVYAFNKQMITDLNLENPYDLVKSGKWTWDKMYEMMQAASVDLNSDGTYDVKEDTLGFTGHVNHLRNLMLSSGETITQTDSDGLPSYSGLTERYIDGYEKFMNYFVDNPIVAIAGCNPSRYAGWTPGVSGNTLNNYEVVFNEGRSLFQCTATYQVRSVRDSEMEYGLVIPPKYDENQLDYVAPVYSAIDGMVIPSTTPDFNRAGLVVETMGALSYNSLVKELITNVLHYKCANNPVDIEMLDLIFAKGQIDVALANNFGTCANILNSLHTYYNHSLLTSFKTIEKRMEADIKAAIEDPQA